MARYRSYGIDFKRQIAQTFLAGETSLNRLAREHGISRNLLRLWIAKYEAGELEDERACADVMSQYEARIAELERKVGQLTMENDLLKKTARPALPPVAGKRSVVSGPKASPSGEDAS